MITIETFVFNHWQENTYILHDETGEGVLIDCGVFFKDEGGKLIDFVEKKGIKLVKQLNTHLHIDHVLGNQFMKDQFGLLTEAHKDDEFLLAEAPNYAVRLGLENVVEPPPIGKLIQEGDLITFGNSELKVIHVPGHSPGHVVFYNEKQKFLIAGDVLFRESIGRTDLPYGNFDQLIEGIKTKLLVLDDEVSVYPGHGPVTSIGHERAKNVFLKGLS
ncbi:MBL fold hydrolase [Labilibaculum filiforme]|uniref:MBL fold hydrolase n=1 Tax=Labilibaculum filiforme TaxID=1940526 RepID=A0A2N3HQN6_9BACT|nr:MBL fold metallo-hydrolase [Labilibaculum filiforme]PKQ60376.1 MBL fold hydrolase [Labilibaculum filiforme]